ncbi:MAG: GNAT family N-acetyltransferase [Xanthomonadales bacterium]|nr:GNAT family N-acetyltransferase [Xanthomonadales bacterium]NIX11956.1 GNAT family N-acetyltransferase [Xanthomonadales bacterium]
MKIRTAEIGDLPALTVLWEEFMDFHADLDPSHMRSEGAADRWVAYVAGILGDTSHRVLVAQEGTELSGYTVALIREYPPIFEFGTFGFIQEIAVAAHRRRRGVARALLDAVEAWLRESGVPNAQVRVDVGNEASRSLFRGAGFEPFVETLIKAY